jgi:hypothetical protein
MEWKNSVGIQNHTPNNKNCCVRTQRIKTLDRYTITTNHSKIISHTTHTILISRPLQLLHYFFGHIQIVMGGQATQKKRRRGMKVTRKLPKHKALKVKNAITHSIIKSEWDNSVSVKDNFKTLGLVTDANDIPGSASSKQPSKPTAFEGFSSVSSTKSTGFDDVNPRRKVMTEFDQQFILRCINKHGNNYTRMARDIKINDRQLSGHQLEKMCIKYYESLENDEKEEL